MLIYNNGELKHTDTCLDIIEHHGIKGMKWGRRKLRQLVDNHKENIRYALRKKGYSEDQVEKHLNRRLKMEKAALIAGGTALATVAAYKGGKAFRDEFLGHKIGSTKTMTLADKINENERFYAAHNKGDIDRYKNIYGLNLAVKTAGNHNENVKRLTTEYARKLKVAPNRAAKKAFEELRKEDPSSVDALVKYHKTLVPNHKLKDYESFNIGMVQREGKAGAVYNKFYDKLKAKGFDAVADINDKKYSGYLAKDPVVVFNAKAAGAKHKLEKIYNNNESLLDLHNAAQKERGKMIRQATINSPSTYAIPGTIAGSIMSRKYLKNKKRRLTDKTYSKKYASK